MKIGKTKKIRDKEIKSFLAAVILAAAVGMTSCGSAGAADGASNQNGNAETEQAENAGTQMGTAMTDADEAAGEATESDSRENGIYNAGAGNADVVSVTVAGDLETEDIPAYSGEPYVVVNENIPDFSGEELTTESFETYSELDELGRCGTAFACIGTDLMPTEERSSIGRIKPSGWHTVKYEGIDGNYLYNRCHLIGYQLTAENANEKNLITGTRYLNIEGMLPFENLVADYIKETGNHVLYRVTPIFKGENLVASGVWMEGYSVEDDGAGISYNIYAYNVQPGIFIEYASGESWKTNVSTVGTEQITGEESNGNDTGTSDTANPGNDSTAGMTGDGKNAGEENINDAAEKEQTYILNTNTKKFHKPDCSSVDKMSEKNKEEYTGTRSELLEEGYSPCGNCNP